MDVRQRVSRRRFFGGVAATVGVLGLRPSVDLFAQGGTQQFRGSDADYDSFAKLASNENNWGPPESVTKAFKEVFPKKAPQTMVRGYCANLRRG